MLTVLTTFIQHGLAARILEWVAIPFSRGSAWSKDGTRVSCIVGELFTVWANRKPIDLVRGRGLPNSVHSRVSLRRHRKRIAKENETRFTFHRFLTFNRIFPEDSTHIFFFLVTVAQLSSFPLGLSTGSTDPWAHLNNGSEPSYWNSF